MAAISRSEIKIYLCFLESYQARLTESKQPHHVGKPREASGESSQELRNLGRTQDCVDASTGIAQGPVWFIVLISGWRGGSPRALLAAIAVIKGRSGCPVSEVEAPDRFTGGSPLSVLRISKILVVLLDKPVQR